MDYNRFSPVSSPSRTRESDDDLQLSPDSYKRQSLNHDEDEIDPPPSYQASATSPSHSTKSKISAKYFAIMDYLEQESKDTTEKLSPRNLQGKDQFDDDVSSISHSPQSIPSHRTREEHKSSYRSQSSAKSKYVWDAIDHDDRHHHQRSDSYYSASALSNKTKTYFTLAAMGDNSHNELHRGDYAGGLTNRFTRQSPVVVEGMKGRHGEEGSILGGSSASTGGNSIETVVAELKGKLTNLKSNLQSHNERAKELHMEMIRLENAKKKRHEKFERFDLCL